MKKERDVKFAEGCFDDWDGTPEELAAFVADIKNMFNADSFPEGVQVRKLTAQEERELLEQLARERETRQ